MTLDVVIDTDPGCDDAIALVQALLSPRLRVRAILLVHGNTTLENTARNLVTILRVARAEMARRGCGDAWRPILVGLGAERPLVVQPRDAHHIYGPYGFGGIYENAGRGILDGVEDVSKGWEGLYKPMDPTVEYVDPDALFIRSAKPASHLLIDLLNDAPAKSLSLITLGPMTNLALSLRANPRIVTERLARVVSLVGAADVPGNVTPCAEYNAWEDPHAAAEVVNATAASKNRPRLNLTVVPIDGSSRCLYSNSLDHLVSGNMWLWVETFAPINDMDPTQAMAAYPAASFFRALTAHIFQVKTHLYKHSAPMELYDSTAVQYVIDLATETSPLDKEIPTGWCTVIEEARVECEGRWTRGQLLVDRRGYPKVSATTPENDTEWEVMSAAMDTKDGKLGLQQDAWGLGQGPQVRMVQDANFTTVPQCIIRLAMGPEFALEK